MLLFIHAYFDACYASRVSNAGEGEWGMGGGGEGVGGRLFDYQG